MTIRTRIIPVLLLRNESLVKTRQFKNFTYVGDPCNTVRIFNELEVDELLFLDITASTENRQPNLSVLADIANECFMPLGYGGGVSCFDDAKKIFEIGFEKIAVNSHAVETPELITELAEHFGSQATIASIDVKKDILGREKVFSMAGTHNTGKDPVEWAQELEHYGAGEILITSIDKEGTWEGFDLDLVQRVVENVDVPVIAHGGAGSLKDIDSVVKTGKADAVALGSMVVFQKKDMGVLVNFPDPDQLRKVLMTK